MNPINEGFVSVKRSIVGNWVQEWFGLLTGSSESYVMVFRMVCALHGLEIADLRPVCGVRS